MEQGGTFITETLKAVVETGKPPLKSRMILWIIGITAFMIPAICKAENWPLDKKGDYDEGNFNNADGE